MVRPPARVFVAAPPPAPLEPITVRNWTHRQFVELAGYLTALEARTVALETLVATLLAGLEEPEP